MLLPQVSCSNPTNQSVNHTVPKNLFAVRENRFAFSIVDLKALALFRFFKASVIA
jgi:hypothetical protein